MKLKLPESSKNWISLIGSMIALISLFMILFLFVITSVTDNEASYLGLVIYILLPAIMIVGLILIPVGMIYQARRLRQGVEVSAPAWPRIDLNDVRHRNAFFIFAIGTTVFLFLSAMGSYQAFQYTESVEFCGIVCHEVMEPEYTAYQNSPHARVACVDCHVGSGADWYVRSKLSGLYQVYAVAVDNYPRPIPTPIENLRPARETCEECHWPQKFYARSLRIERHYISDEQNTPWDIHLNVKVGSDYGPLGLVEGTHWHINPNVRIEYYAADEKVLEIPWVRYTDLETGDEIIYIDEDNPVEAHEIDPSLIKTMDCMDCHNRPSHSYKSPSTFINEAMTAGEIPSQLPKIKILAMELCGEEYPTTDSAFQAIEQSVREFYADNYPEIQAAHPAWIDRAVAGIQNAFGKNIFPRMNARWSVYPNHIGHLEFDGCFRCHNNRHISDAGDRIGMDCNQCHVIIAQGTPGEISYAEYGNPLDFKHPVDIGEAWRDALCTDCHTGLSP